MDVAPQPDSTAPYLFVSYASADRDRVLPVVEALRAAGVTVWLDQQGIAGGENYGTAIADAIKGSAVFVLMASTASLTSRNVKQEIALGWRFERPYLPLLLEPVAIPDELAYWLEAAQWVEVLDKEERVWLPPVLAALATLGIAPKPVEHEEIHLAGRERELTLLREKLSNAKQGRGGLVLIGGEAGIGKTTLAETGLRVAEGQGFAVLEGHCFDLAETPPYGPWIDLFARFQPSPASPPLPEAFVQRGTVGAVPNQMALFVQVQDFLAALARRQPIAMLLDDLHWADPASCDLLRYLARSLPALPVLILATYRSDELTRKHPLAPLLPQLARDAGAERIDLGQLDDAAVRDLVDDRYHLPETDAVRLVHHLRERGEGNALFVGELLRSFEESGALRREGDHWRLAPLDALTLPPLLRQVIDGRIARLDGESQRLLAVAAVVGHESPLAALGTLAEMGDEALLLAVERASEAHLLVEAPDGLHVRFAHALIREALYDGISPARRRLLHRRVGELFAAQPRPDPDAVAMHFQRASDGRAVAWLVRAGERAQLAYAWLTAAERYEAALALLEGGEEDLAQQGWLRYRIARLRRLSAPQQGVEYLDEALRIAVVVGDPALAAAARYSRGLCLTYDADFVAGIREMAAGADALEALPPDEQVRLDLGPDAQGLPTITNPRGYVVAMLAGCGRIAEAITMGEATREGVPRRTSLSELGWAHHGDRDGGLSTAYALAGRPIEARDAFARGRDIYRALGNYSTLGGSTVSALVQLSLPYFTERREEQWRMAEESAAARARAGTGGGHNRMAHIPVLTISGRWAEARAEAETTLRSGLSGLWRQYVGTMLCEVAHRQGDADAVGTHINAMLPNGPRTAPGGIVFWVGLTMLRLASDDCLTTGGLPQARLWIEAYDRWLAWSGAVLWASEGQALWAQYHRRMGDMEQAYVYAERALALAAEPRQPLALLTAHRLLGELDTDTGRYDEATTHLDESLAIATACEAPYERALTLLAMAELRAATGETDAARTLLDEVRAICEPLGAKPTLTRAEQLAARIGNVSAPLGD